MEDFKKEGCSACVHDQSKWDWVDYDTKPKFTCVSRVCAKGNHELLAKWWQDNGHRSSGHDIMECHEYSETSKSLIRMSNNLDEISKIIDNHFNKNNSK